MQNTKTSKKLKKKHTKKAIISDCTTPFEVSVVTDGTRDEIAAGIADSNKGKYILLPIK